MPRRNAGPRYLEITDRILEALERGTVPWQRPWASTRPVSAITGRPYRAINRLMLEFTAAERGYRSNAWLTFNAARRCGGHVRRGEAGSMILFYERRPKREKVLAAWDLEVDQEWVYTCGHHFVFNVEQCSGIEGLTGCESEPAHMGEAGAVCEHILKQAGARIVVGGDVAAYDPHADVIHLPPQEAFASEPAWISTAMHEAVHWTGHSSRLARPLTGRMADPEYAREELVAELGSAFLCGDIGVESVSQSAAYLDSWLRAMRSDCRAIVVASRQAQLAADYLLGEAEESESAYIAAECEVPEMADALSR